VPASETDRTDEPTPLNPTSAEPLVEDALVEEVSIDGMCGVY
jgi:mycofactocin precursor